jgi:hypothetical protein
VTVPPSGNSCLGWNIAGIGCLPRGPPSKEEPLCHRAAKHQPPHRSVSVASEIYVFLPDEQVDMQPVDNACRTSRHLIQLTYRQN